MVKAAKYFSLIFVLVITSFIWAPCADAQSLRRCQLAAFAFEEIQEQLLSEAYLQLMILTERDDQSVILLPGHRGVVQVSVPYGKDQPGLLLTLLDTLKDQCLVEWMSYEAEEAGARALSFGVVSEDEKSTDQMAKWLQKLRKQLTKAIRKRISVSNTKVIRTKVTPTGESYVLQIALDYRSSSLQELAKLLGSFEINIKNFLLTGMNREIGTAAYLFELEISESAVEKLSVRAQKIRLRSAYRTIDFEEDTSLEANFRDVIESHNRAAGSLARQVFQSLSKRPKEKEVFASNLKPGTLIDYFLERRILNRFELAPPETKAILKEAFMKIAATKISKLRKNLEPYLQHQAEIVDLLVDFIGVRKVDILIAAILHDAVEDNDLTISEVESQFGSSVASIVTLLTRDQKKTLSSEKSYFSRLLSAEGIEGLAAVLIKLKDRLHNLITLQTGNRAFERAFYFQTLYTFMIDFVEKINLEKIENKDSRELIAQAIEILRLQVILTGMKLGFIDEKGVLEKSEFDSYLQSSAGYFEGISGSDFERATNYDVYQRLLRSFAHEVRAARAARYLWLSLRTEGLSGQMRLLQANLKMLPSSFLPVAVAFYFQQWAEILPESGFEGGANIARSKYRDEISQRHPILTIVDDFLFEKMGEENKKELEGGEFFSVVQSSFILLDERSMGGPLINWEGEFFASA